MLAVAGLVDLILRDGASSVPCVCVSLAVHCPSSCALIPSRPPSLLAVLCCAVLCCGPCVHAPLQAATAHGTDEPPLITRPARPAQPWLVSLSPCHSTTVTTLVTGRYVCMYVAVARRRVCNRWSSVSVWRRLTLRRAARPSRTNGEPTTVSVRLRRPRDAPKTTTRQSRNTTMTTNGANSSLYTNITSIDEIILR